MPTTLSNGVRVPVGTDPAAPQTDMAALGRSVRTILTASSASDATSKVSQAASKLGWSASVAQPVMVYRTDLGHLTSWDGSTWSDVLPVVRTATATASHGWAMDQPSSGTVHTAGRVHTMPICIKRTGGAFTTSVGTRYDMIRLPAGVPTPTVDWQVLGTIVMGAYVCPVIWNASTRHIAIVGAYGFNAPNLTWFYGHATWIT